MLLTSSLFAASTPWQNASAEELAQKESSLERGTAAEAILRRVEVDDSDYPSNRMMKEYIRYKVYDPEKAAGIMRLSRKSASLDGVEFQSATMKARVTQPDGTIKEFGSESIHERLVARDSAPDTLLNRLFGTAGAATKEKFLVVGGVLPGAVLELYITVEGRSLGATFFPIQMPGIPIRKFEFLVQESNIYRNFGLQFFALNGGEAEKKSDREKKLRSFTKMNLPSLREEPFSGAPAYYSTTLVLCYNANYVTSHSGASQTRHFSPDLPWVQTATVENWFEMEHVNVTSGVKKTAADIVRGAGSDLEKARRIHDYVAQLYLRFVHQKKRELVVILTSDIVSMDDVISFEKRKPEHLTRSDFLYLAISLYRAAGLTSEVIMVPDRRVAPFVRSFVSSAFLQDDCAAIKIGSTWHFSFPVGLPAVAFDELPWEFEGQGGLLALDNQQQFIDVPLSPAEHSGLNNTGTFELSVDGTLRGQCKLVCSGHEAYRIRSQLESVPTETQQTMTQDNLRKQFSGAEITVKGIANLEDPYKPVEITYDLLWPGFAVKADKRLIFHPCVFRNLSASPFSSEERTYPVIFDFLHQENDSVNMTLPAGYELEVKNAPLSFPAKLLSYKVALTFNHRTRVLHSERAFSNELISVGVKGYPALKKWYDEVSDSDQHQFVLLATEPSMASSPASSP